MENNLNENDLRDFIKENFEKKLEEKSETMGDLELKHINDLKNDENLRNEKIDLATKSILKNYEILEKSKKVNVDVKKLEEFKRSLMSLRDEDDD